eukprot:6935935-Karenia_brevis.AAC.1
MQQHLGFVVNIWGFGRQRSSLARGLRWVRRQGMGRQQLIHQKASLLTEGEFMSSPIVFVNHEHVFHVQQHGAFCS